MKRLLPPIVVLAVLAAVGVRVALRPGCEAMRERVRDLLVDANRRQEALTAIEDLLGHCDGFEDRWFAAEAYMRAGRYQDALARVFSDAWLSGTPGASRRFGRMGLETLGWYDPAHEEPTSGEPAALIALVEARVPWAEALLERYARTRRLEQVTDFLFHASRYAGRHPLAVLVRGLRAHEARTQSGATPEDARAPRIAAAFSALGRDPYPQREQDIEALLDALKRFRETKLDAWTASAAALGRSEDPRALAALRAYAKRLEGSTHERDARELALLRCALLGAGDWSQYEALKPLVTRSKAHRFLTAWYLEALLHRFALEDPKARIPLGDVWLDLGPQDVRARLRIAMALLLQDEPPAADTAELRGPIQKMVEDLVRSPDSPISRVLGVSYLLRAGDPTARDRLIALLGHIAEAWEADPQGKDAQMRPAWILGLRALLLYGRPD